MTVRVVLEQSSLRTKIPDAAHPNHVFSIAFALLNLALYNTFYICLFQSCLVHQQHKEWWQLGFVTTYHGSSRTAKLLEVCVVQIAPWIFKNPFSFFKLGTQWSQSQRHQIQRRRQFQKYRFIIALLYVYNVHIVYI